MREKSDEFFINSIVFNEQPITVIEQDEINNQYLDSLLVLIDEFLIVHNDKQAFDSFVIQNACSVINFIRNNYNYDNENDKKIKYQKYNDLILRLNGGLRTNSDEFYEQHFFERRIYLDYKFHNNTFYVPEQFRDYVRLSLSLDKFFYDILNKRIENVSESEKSMLTMNSLFLCSVNYFKFECPELLEKNLILKRILLDNKKIIESFKFRFGLDSKYEKTNCLVKSSKQLLKEIRW